MTNTETKFKEKYVRDYYVEYEAANLRSVHFYAKGRALEDKDGKLASAYGTEGDRHTDLLADAHGAIVRTKVRNLEDVHYKLLVLRDDLKALFNSTDDRYSDQRKMLDEMIEWSLAHSLCGDEKLPDSTSPEIANQEAA